MSNQCCVNFLVPFPSLRSFPCPVWFTSLGLLFGMGVTKGMFNDAFKNVFHFYVVQVLGQYFAVP